MKNRRGDNFERMCVACRRLDAKNNLYRFVRTFPDGDLVLDETGKAQGRGAYLCKKAECVDKAIKSNSISKALKKDASTLLKQIRENLND